MPGRYFPATAKTKASYSCRDGQDRPVVFVGGVTVSNTKDRPNPPDPICGMKLGGTSLGNGHIMALQLGGPDYSENIVPQYQQWQQSGRWRVLEKNAMTHCAVGSWIFVAHLHYGNTHKSGLNHKIEFESGNTSIFWDDPLIPTVFDIWLIQATTDEGKAILKDILDPKAKDGERETAAVKLPADLAAVGKFASNTDQATEMPKEDRDYWRKNELARVVGSMFEEYRADRADQMQTAGDLAAKHKIGAAKERDEMMDVLLSPVRETEHEFVQGYGDTIRKTLEKQQGWIDFEISQYGSNTNMLEAVFHVPKLSGQQKKSDTSRLKKYGELQGTKAETRRKYAKRSEPYNTMGDTFKRGYKGDALEDDKDQTYDKRLQRFINGMSK